MEEVKNHLANIIPYSISYYRQIKKKFGAGRERKTEIRGFDTITATEVALANAKLYVNRAEGFIGTGLKKDEYVCDCSDIDDIIVIRKDGKFIIAKVSEKQFVGKDMSLRAYFKKNDERTIYNVIYRDGENGTTYIKRCAITGLMRGKEYTLTKGESGSRILYLSVNPNGEAETVKVTLKPRPRVKKWCLTPNSVKRISRADHPLEISSPGIRCIRLNSRKKEFPPWAERKSGGMKPYSDSTWKGKEGTWESSRAMTGYLC